MIVSHFDKTYRRLMRPIRQWQWQRRRDPFIHRGARGIRFRLHPPEYIDSQIYSEGIYELELLRFLAANFRGRTMVDVGANIGNHSLYLLRNFEQVHCFEPNPITASRLRENARLNDAGLIIHQLGLGSEDAELAFRSNDRGNLGGGSFMTTRFPVSDILPVRRGDDYFKARTIRNIDLIKIDVEGFERDVLAGLQGTIERDRPTIVFEFDGRAREAFGAIASLLSGYEFHTIRSGSLAKLKWPEKQFYEAIIAIRLG